MKSTYKQIRDAFLDLFHYNSEVNYENPINNNATESTLKITEDFILNKKLQHLEYINYLESNMTNNRLRFLPLDFLRDLENYKLQSQISAITTSKELLLKSA